MFRIALGAIFTECNELGGVPIDLSWFERFDLKRVEADVLMAHLGNIASMESVEAEPEALGMIARAPCCRRRRDCLRWKGWVCARPRVNSRCCVTSPCLFSQESRGV